VLALGAAQDIVTLPAAGGLDEAVEFACEPATSTGAEVAQPISRNIMLNTADAKKHELDLARVISNPSAGNVALRISAREPVTM
jgi:hypothetical protein